MSAAGVDPSLTATGVARADGGLITLTSKPTGDGVRERVGRIQDMAERVRTQTLGASLIVIEGPAYGAQAQAGVHLRAGLWWAIAARLATPSYVELVEVAPSALKRFATGRGNATKPDMRMALFQRAGIDCRDNDQVDAWWLRQIGLHLLDHPDRITMPQTHLAALTSVRGHRKDATS